MAGELNYEIVRRYVDDVVVIDDDAIADAVRELLVSAKLLAEPAARPRRRRARARRVRARRRARRRRRQRRQRGFGQARVHPRVITPPPSDRETPTSSTSSQTIPTTIPAKTSVGQCTPR